MKNILSPIINSVKKSWRGEENFWKVFWLWGVLLYFVMLALFLVCLLPSTCNIYRIIMMYNFFLILPIILALVIKRNIKNIKVKNRVLKIIVITFVLSVPLILSVNIAIGWGLFGFGLGNIIDRDQIFFPILISVIIFNFLFYRKIKYQIKLIS